ncbi:MAG TPA: helix-turn-helix domain-containing protein [Arenimonas sp.]|uniref:helix-turn-helix domain-containing protein n=1 Tax=Arenimonas sp. TaxID=1872635 RepID=UPI002C10FFB2|nr:helix-turn-helix domain-containing protein [Arenimonas sp.]HMB56588.1 helix-turn-helix domain-containing protein [Arenimonas sp.]
MVEGRDPSVPASAAAPAGGAGVIDLARLRRSCSQCSLKVLCLPASIGREDIDRLDRIVLSRRPLARGDVLFHAGQALGSLYVAREGVFKTTAADALGDLQVLGFHLPGELMGLDALGSGQHACEAQALTRADVCEVPLAQLESVASEVPGLQHQLLRIMGQSMGRDQQHIELLGRRNAQERMATFLHQLSERYRALGRPGDSFLLPMSREDIASYLGLVIETVSRTLSKMQDDGVIAVHGREMKILDGERLNGLAHDYVSGSRAQR